MSELFRRHLKKSILVGRLSLLCLFSGCSLLKSAASRLDLEKKQHPVPDSTNASRGFLSDENVASGSKEIGSLRSRGRIHRISVEGLSSEDKASLKVNGQFLFAQNDQNWYFFENNLNPLPQLLLAEMRILETFENSVGSLQALEGARAFRPEDPSLGLQWYLFPNFVDSRRMDSVSQIPKFTFRKQTWSREQGKFWWAQGSPNHWKTVCSQKVRSPNAFQDLWRISASTKFTVPLIVHDSKIDATHRELKEAFLGSDEDALGYRSLIAEEIDSNIKLPLATASMDHGTHIAGIISASRNDRGTTGIVPNLPLVNLSFPSESSGKAVSDVTLKNAIVGLEKIRQSLTLMNHGAGPFRTQVIYLGYGFEVSDSNEWDSSHPFAAMIANLLQLNVIIVVPNGNVSHPDSFSGVMYPGLWNLRQGAKEKFMFEKMGMKGRMIGISSIDACGLDSWFNYSAVLQRDSLNSKNVLKQISFPGDNVYSTLSHDDFGFLSGSSQAAAQTAAILGFASNVSPKKNASELVQDFYESLENLERDESSIATSVLNSYAFLNKLNLDAENKLSTIQSSHE